MERKMFILMSHTMTKGQEASAREDLHIGTFVVVPEEKWKQIPAEADSVCSHLHEIKRFLIGNAHRGDYLWVQGDFGATVNMVTFAKRMGLIPVYATTERRTKESVQGEEVKTTRVFAHVRFREYEIECL